MSQWIRYEALVDLIRKKNADRFTGLITGVSEQKHSFQIGFENGTITLLNYRMKKGSEALALIHRIVEAKIIVHATTDAPEVVNAIPETQEVLSQLTASAIIEPEVNDIGDVPDIQHKASESEAAPTASR